MGGQLQKETDLVVGDEYTVTGERDLNDFRLDHNYNTKGKLKGVYYSLKELPNDKWYHSKHFADLETGIENMQLEKELQKPL